MKAGKKLTKKELDRVYKRLVKGGVVVRIPIKVADAADLVRTYAAQNMWEDWEFRGLTSKNRVDKLRLEIENLRQVIATNAEIASGKKKDCSLWRKNQVKE